MIVIQVESPEFCPNDCPYFRLEERDVTLTNGKQVYRGCANAKLCQFARGLEEEKK